MTQISCASTKISFDKPWPQCHASTCRDRAAATLSLKHRLNFPRLLTARLWSRQRSGPCPAEHKSKSKPFPRHVRSPAHTLSIRALQSCQALRSGTIKETPRTNSYSILSWPVRPADKEGWLIASPLRRELICSWKECLMMVFAQGGNLHSPSAGISNSAVRK